jgi:tRNA nucleotidyltransferase (CCA-adding enzyme)
MSEHVLRAAAQLPQAPESHRDAILFCIIIGSQGHADAINRLRLTQRQAAAVRSCAALVQGAGYVASPSRRSSEAAAVFQRQSLLGVEAFALLADEPRAAVLARRYLQSWRLLKPRLNGNDVQALGVPPGPDVGRVLDMLLNARIDNETGNRADEEALVHAARSRLSIADVS